MTPRTYRKTKVRQHKLLMTLAARKPTYFNHQLTLLNKELGYANPTDDRSEVSEEETLRQEGLDRETQLTQKYQRQARNQRLKFTGGQKAKILRGFSFDSGRQDHNTIRNQEDTQQSGSEGSSTPQS